MSSKRASWISKFEYRKEMIEINADYDSSGPSTSETKLAEFRQAEMPKKRDGH